MNRIIFHLAIPISNIEQAKKFYGEILNAKIGRENKQAIIFDFYGHQLVGHLSSEPLMEPKSIYPRHFGIIFTAEADWDNLLTQCHRHQLSLYQPSRLRFAGEITEHKTFFLQDPFYNILEFKFYRHYEAIFGANQFTEIGDR